MRKQKQDLFSKGRARRPKPVYFKLAVFSATGIILLLFALGLLRLAAARLDFFRVKEIIVRENFSRPAPGSIDLSYLKGRGILAVDLRRESAYLSGLYPSYKRVRLFRIFPNRLFADFITRRPIAYLRLHRLFYVSDDLVLFDAPLDFQDQRLTVITGLETKIPGPRSGSRYTVRELVFSLKVIGEFRLNRSLRDYKLKRINAANLDNFSFFLLYGPGEQAGSPSKDIRLLEIKVSPDRLRDRLNILSGLLGKLKNQRQMLSYIDLRFNDPVIKLNREE